MALSGRERVADRPAHSGWIEHDWQRGLSSDLQAAVRRVLGADRDGDEAVRSEKDRVLPFAPLDYSLKDVVDPWSLGLFIVVGAGLLVGAVFAEFWRRT